MTLAHGKDWIWVTRTEFLEKRSKLRKMKRSHIEKYFSYDEHTVLAKDIICIYNIRSLHSLSFLNALWKKRRDKEREVTTWYFNWCRWENDGARSAGEQWQKKLWTQEWTLPSVPKPENFTPSQTFLLPCVN